MSRPEPEARLGLHSLPAHLPPDALQRPPGHGYPKSLPSLPRAPHPYRHGLFDGDAVWSHRHEERVCCLGGNTGKPRAEAGHLVQEPKVRPDLAEVVLALWG